MFLEVLPGRAKEISLEVLPGRNDAEMGPANS